MRGTMGYTSLDLGGGTRLEPATFLPERRSMTNVTLTGRFFKVLLWN